MTDPIIVTQAVERVAEAMWQAESHRAAGRDRLVPWREAGEEAQRNWRYLAEAALASIPQAGEIGELVEHFHTSAAMRRDIAADMAGHPAADGHLAEAERLDRKADTILSLLAERDVAQAREARLREALRSIVRKWETNEAKDVDEWSDGYEDALADCAEIARSTLSEGTRDNG